MKKLTMHYPNMKATHDVVSHMRNDNRAISHLKFRQVFCASHGWRLRDHQLYQNYKQPIAFLEQNGIITTTKVNNFTFYVLTQKGFKSKMEKLFPTLYI